MEADRGPVKKRIVTGVIKTNDTRSQSFMTIRFGIKISCKGDFKTAELFSQMLSFYNVHEIWNKEISPTNQPVELSDPHFEKKLLSFLNLEALPGTLYTTCIKTGVKER